MNARNAVVGAVGALFVATAGSAAPSWQRLPDMPEPMGNFACGVIGRDIAAVGGMTWRGGNKLFLDGIWRWQDAQATWTLSGRLSRPVAYAAFGQIGGEFCIAGGSDGAQMRQEVLRIEGKGIHPVVSTIPCQSAFAGSAVVRDKLWVIAGARDSGDLKTMTSAVLSLDPQRGETKPLPDYPGGALMLPAAVCLGETVYTFTGGGLDAAGQVGNVDLAFAYSVRRGEWRPIAPYPLKVRGLSACPLDDRYILLGGGYVSEFTDAAFLYDVRDNMYLKATPLPYAAMVTLIRAGDYVYCLGGEDRMKHRTNLFYRIPVAELLKAARLPRRPADGNDKLPSP